MGLIDLKVLTHQPISGGRRFGKFGPYEAITAEVKYAVDPSLAANQQIVDLDKAPLNQAGNVEFNGNLTLIQPSQAAPTCLLIDVPNRGRRITGMFNRVNPAEALNDPFTAGDGFLYRHGFSVLSIGWQFDVVEGMQICVPTAQVDGKELSGEVVCQMQTGRNTSSLFFGQTTFPIYKPSGRGRLYRREHTRAVYDRVPDDSWRFGRLVNGEFHASEHFICSELGFEKGVVYTLVYETERAPVVGLGLLALRDATSYFRYDLNQPRLFRRAPNTIAFGASQTGRVLRHFVSLGLNADEQGRTVFDAVIPHIAGGQRGDFNHRYAQPGSMGVPAAGQLFPFSFGSSHDVFTHQTASLRDADSTNVKVLATNTSWEYWRGDAALSHVETDGNKDIELSKNDRAYLFSGTHHINGILPLTSQLLLNGEHVCYPLNTISYTPLIRAVLLNALRWIVDEIEPPPSNVPTIRDSTLVSRTHVIQKFRSNGNFPRLPDPAVLTGLNALDLGPQIEQGICSFPAHLLQPYVDLVSDVDPTLNEVAGIRLPEIELPIGIHTGWNPRHEQHGAATQTATFAGLSSYAIAATDLPQRVFVEEQVHKCVDRLIDQRYVLAEDRDLVIENAMQRYELLEQATLTKSPK